MSEPSWTIERHQEAASTNDLAKAAAKRGAGDRTVFVAGRQTGGRGRGENEWASPEGGLYASALLRTVPATLAPLLPLAAGEALVRAVRALAPDVPCWLKWPNDLLVAAPGETEPRGKAGGVLVETVSRGAGLDHAVIGIGVNLHNDDAHLPRDLDPPAVALGGLTQKTLDPAFFLDVLLGHLAHVLTAYRSSPRRLVDAVATRLAWRDEEVRADLVEGGVVTGRLVGLTETGALRLETEAGEIFLDGWHVRRVRPAT